LQAASHYEPLPAFKPAPGFRNAHLQTILAKYLAPRRPLHTRVEMLQLPDKDELQLNWSLDAEDCSKPLVVLLHGLEGNIHSHYIRGMFHSLRQQGFGVVLMHFRGCHGVANKLPRAYHSGDTADFALFLQLCRGRYPNRPLLAIGFSLGGNVLVKYCGEAGVGNLLAGAVAVCAPLALAPSSDRINQGFSKLYQRYLLGRLKGTMQRKLAAHADFPLPLTARDIGKIRSIRQFDDLLTAPLHGFRDAEHYYHSCSGLNFLPQVQKPLLLIHALDDPFLASAVIPQQLPPQVQLHLCKHGGHVGFLAGTPWRPQYWLDHVVPHWLNRLSYKQENL
jgi:hypothetical protein